MVKRFRKQYRIRRKRSLWKNKFLWYALGVVFVVCVLFYGCFFAPFVQVKEVRVEGEGDINKAMVERIVKEEIADTIFGLENSSIIFVNTGKIAGILSRRFPAIESVSVKRVLPANIAVNITPREEIVSWCRFIDGSGACVGVDRFGVAFKGASSIDFYITGPADLTHVAWGDGIVDPDLLSVLLNFQKEVDAWNVLKDEGVRVKELQIISQSQVIAVFSEEWKAYLNPVDDMAWQLTKLKLVLEQEIPKEQRPELEYIDLRFGDRAYVKYQE